MSLEKKMIRDILTMYEEILKLDSDISLVDLQDTLRPEMLKRAHAFYGKYNSLPFVKRDPIIEMKFHSCLVFKDYHSIYVPFSFYLDKVRVVTHSSFIEELTSLNGKCPERVITLLEFIHRFKNKQFPIYKPIHIQILKAMIALYDKNSFYENPSTEALAKYIRKNYESIRTHRSHLTYFYRVLVNYGKIGFYTLAIWDLPVDLQEFLEPFFLMKFSFGHSQLIVLALPYSVCARLRDILENIDFPESSIFVLKNQSWNWNLSQLAVTEKESWNHPILLVNDIIKTLKEEILTEMVPLRQPYIFQDITPSLNGSPIITLKISDMSTLQRLMCSFPSIKNIAAQTFTTESQVYYSFQRLKESGIINIRTDISRIGLGASFGLIITVPDLHSTGYNPTIQSLITLLLKYPFTWILSGNTVLVACIVLPSSWVYDFYADWSKIAQLFSNTSYHHSSACDFALRTPYTFQSYYQLKLENLWYEKDEVILWKDPLINRSQSRKINQD